jgi:uncharacterized protein (DUF1800 family)
MNSAQRSGSVSPLFSVRASLAALLSLAMCLPFGFEVPPASAQPIPDARDKKPMQDPALKGLPITELTEDEAILHALNRLAFGPRPGDVEHIKQIGLKNWIEQQLNPNSIDDHAMEARLENYPTLKMTSAQLIAEYPRPKQALKRQERRAQAEMRSPDEAAASVIAQDMKSERSNSAETQTAAGTQPNGAAPAGDANALSPMKQEPAMENPDATAGGRGKRNAEPDAVPPAFAENSHRPRRVVAELAMAKMTRAIYSRRQLQQVMDDFWFNHFNVYAAKGADVWLLTSYERDAIQPHTLGKFRDLLEATAKSPAMLFYLDNFLSVDPNAAQRIAQERAMRQQMRYRRFGYGRPFPPPMQRPSAQNKKQQMVRGINKNYGRELMELHTLGVDGGYTQKDVTEVARCFTGWSIERPQIEAKFKFNDQLHDPGPK